MTGAPCLGAFHLLDLRAKVWGKESLHIWDAKAPVVDTNLEKISFTGLKTTILDSLSVMGSDYMRLIERAFDERWIYWGDNVGKAQRAYCLPTPGRHPYVFTGFQGIFYNTFIMTHELGHGAHLMYSDKAQVEQNRLSSYLFIEAPSTFHEQLLVRYLRESGNRETYLQAICMQLFSFHHNFVTHLTEAELLRRLYAIADAKQPITASVLDKVQLSILKEFWGDTIELDEMASWTWMRQPHYYMGLLPYAYSVGLAGSTALAVRMERGEDLAERWIGTLKMGGSAHALTLFQNVGLNMDSETPYREAVAYVGRLIDELENALG